MNLQIDPMCAWVTRETELLRMICRGYSGESFSEIIFVWFLGHETDVLIQFKFNAFNPGPVFPMPILHTFLAKMCKRCARSRYKNWTSMPESRLDRRQLSR